MPIHSGRDKKGTFWQWGGHGAKYYFNSPQTAARAHFKAQMQAAAARANGYRKS